MTSEGPLESKSEKVELTGKKITEVKEKPAPPDPAVLMAKLNELGDSMRALIIEVKRLPWDRTLGPYQDPVRSIAIGQSQLQTGFMWVRRAIEPNRLF